MRNLSISEVAQRIEETTGASVHRATIWRWANHGVGGRRLPIQRVGGRIYVRPGDLETFLTGPDGH